MGVAERSVAPGSAGSWFADQRTPVRRMRVSWHPDRGIVILSLWQGDACTATFRLPITDAPRLIGLLADGLGDAVAGAPPAHGPAPTSFVRRLRDRVARWLRRPQSASAPVIPIEHYR